MGLRKFMLQGYKRAYALSIAFHNPHLMGVLGAQFDRTHTMGGRILEQQLDSGVDCLGLAERCSRSKQCDKIRLVAFMLTEPSKRVLDSLELG